MYTVSLRVAVHNTRTRKRALNAAGHWALGLGGLGSGVGYQLMYNYKR
jgi:hypothetical protein